MVVEKTRRRNGNAPGQVPELDFAGPVEFARGAGQGLAVGSEGQVLDPVPMSLQDPHRGWVVLGAPVQDGESDGQHVEGQQGSGNEFPVLHGSSCRSALS